MKIQSLLAALCAAGALFAGQAEARLINFDLISGGGGDPYGPGAGVFGTASSQWNYQSRLNSASNLALTDDTGAATSVTVSYTRIASSSNSLISGTFANLGNSSVGSGTVTLSGLTGGQAYDLVIYDGWTGVAGFASWTVNGNSQGFTATNDWSTLTAGQNYVLFSGVVADGAGTLSFTPNAGPFAIGNTSPWTAFQIQDASTPPPPSVPEPGILALLGLVAAAARRMSRRSA